jgi:exopolysaccharide biosynthesis WecB/TagA/CpsF family protein
MLIRQTLLYLPSQLIAPLLQFIAAVAWTHWMGAADYGVLSIAMAAQDLAFFVCLGWWSQSTLRYLGDAQGADARRSFVASESLVLIVASILQAGVALAAVAATDAAMTVSLALSVAAFTITRSLATYLADRARAEGRIGLYTLSQLVGPALGFALAWLALTQWRASADAALWGFALAQALGVVAAAIPLGVGRAVTGASRGVIFRALAYGAPLIVAGALTWVSTNGVRLIVERLGTMADVGLLSVGWGLGLRLSSVAALLFAAAAYPLALKAMRAGERGQAMAHLSLNGALLAGLLAPLAAGLFLIAPPVVELMVAAPYREATIAVLPAATLAGAVRNWRAHFVDQSFLVLAKTWHLMGLSAFEAAVVSIGCVVGMSRAGVAGAAWGACLGMIASTALSLAVASLRHGLRAPWRDMALIGLATAAMAGCVSLVPGDLRPVGLELAARIGVGAMVYPVALLALHAPLRRWLTAQARRWRGVPSRDAEDGGRLAGRNPVQEPVSMTMRFDMSHFDKSLPDSAAPARLAQIDGRGVNVATLADAVRLAADNAARGVGFTLFTLNLDHLVKLRAEPDFARAYDRATFVTADGWPIAWLARRQGAAGVERATGADLVDPLCAEAARRGITAHFFGSSDATLTSAARVLTARHPGLVVAGMEAPPMGFDPLSQAADEAAERIAASGAGLCFVAFGAPKQELFAARMAQRYPRIGFVCIGAALDFIAGEKARAPAIFQKTGLEWAWRLMSEPRRMFGRYARCAAVFADVALRGPRGTQEASR